MGLDVRGLMSALFAKEVRWINIPLAFLGAAAITLFSFAAFLEPGQHSLFRFALLSFSLVGLLLAGVFSVLGKLVEFRDESGQITSWGATTLVAAASGAIIAVFSFGIQQITEAASAASAARESNRLLTRFDGLSFEISMQVDPVFDPLLQAAYQAEQAGTPLPFVQIGANTYITNCMEGWPDFGLAESTGWANRFEGMVFTFAIVDGDFAAKIEEGLRLRLEAASSSPLDSGTALLQILEQQERATSSSDDPFSTIMPISAEPYLAGRIFVPETGDDSKCAVRADAHPIYVNSHSDTFLRIRTPVLLMSDTFGDGTIVGAPDLSGRVLILASTMFNSPWGPGNSVIDDLSVTIPPAGTFCFSGNRENGLRTVTFGSGAFLAFADLDRPSPRVSSWC